MTTDPNLPRKSEHESDDFEEIREAVREIRTVFGDESFTIKVEGGTLLPPSPPSR